MWDTHPKPMEGAPILQAENLAKSYQSGRERLSVFENLNFTVRRGERLALIGESGAGKSTLLHLLGGLDRPSAGRIFYESRLISEFDEAGQADYRNRHVGFVWQIHHLLPEFTAIENVMMPLLIRGVSAGEARTASSNRLDAVGLLSRAGHRAGELSGGERQRVVLARALVAEPSLLLADEPTGNLDQKTGDAVISLIEQLHEEFGLTSVFVTHNLAFAARCDRALRLEAGELIPASLTD